MHTCKYEGVKIISGGVIAEGNTVDHCDDDEMTDDKIEAFLNSCDNEVEEDDDNDVGGLEDNNDKEEIVNYFVCDTSFIEDSSIENLSLVQTAIKADLHALDALMVALRDAKLNYAKNPLTNHFKSKNTKINYEVTQSEQYTAQSQIGSHNKDDHGSESTFVLADQYCSILLHSEMQTIEFYLAAAESAKIRLMAYSEQLPSRDHSIMQPQSEKFHQSMNMQGVEKYQFDNREVAWKHINDLVRAFLSIRHPQLQL